MNRMIKYMMKRKCIFKIMTVVSMMVLIISTSVQAAIVTTNSWDLVDSGKHLDWDGETNYLIYFTDAISTWNGYKAGVIRKDSLFVVEDVYISDYSGDSETIVKVYQKGKIKFNQEVMDTLSDTQKENACATALGVALGLGKTNNKLDIMYKYVNTKTSLSENDKASYDKAYDGY